jgi:hypothetical protein
MDSSIRAGKVGGNLKPTIIEAEIIGGLYGQCKSYLDFVGAMIPPKSY